MTELIRYPGASDDLRAGLAPGRALGRLTLAAALVLAATLAATRLSDESPRPGKAPEPPNVVTPAPAIR